MHLLDNGVVDTFGSVSATSGVHTSVSVNASDSARIPFVQPIDYHRLFNKLSANA
jgi:hypothetical protein